MPDKKLTDSEIVKALECCKNDGIICHECPYKKTNGCMERLSTDALDLINRLQEENKNLQERNVILRGLVDTQKAENEKWQQVAFKHEETLQIIATEKQYYFDKLQFAKADIEKLKDKYSAIYQPIGNAIAEAKSEAYKEFANELKCRTHEISYNTLQVVTEYDIDNLLKELVGEDK